MSLRSYFNRKFSTEASPEARTRVVEALRGRYSSDIARRPALRQRSQEVLSMLDKTDKVIIYPWMLNPPAHLPGLGCFDPTFDFQYDPKTKTLEIGGSLGDL